MKRPLVTITATRDPRPWWAPWRRTVSLRCSEHGVFASGLVPLVTESGFDFVHAAATLHHVATHKAPVSGSERSDL